MHMAMSERLRERIAALCADYVATFPKEIAGFRQALRSTDEDSVKLIARRAHRIAGTSGSYQLKEVCAAAQAVERLYEEGKEEDIADAARVLCERMEDAVAAQPSKSASASPSAPPPK